MRHEFSEVLNDLVDYFLLGDIQLLERFKQEHELPDDLAYAFTLDGHTPALREAGSRLKHRRNGYVLRVEHGALMLYTWRILQHFTPKTLGDLIARYQVPGRPIIELDNGWYDVEVLAGALVRDGLYEPAFEFVLKKRWSRGEAAQVDTGYAFGLRGYFD